MSQNPINLAVRFVLELCALFALGYWGWAVGSGWSRFLLAFGLPLIGAALWGTFRVPGDASSSGGAPVAVPGWVRLLLELGLFGSATWAFYNAGAERAAWLFGAVVLIHYALSYDRIAWLLRR